MLEMRRLLVALACVVSVELHGLAGAEVRYPDHSLYVVTPATQAHLDVLATLWRSHQYVFWTDGWTPDSSHVDLDVEILVPPRRVSFFKRVLQGNHIASRLKVGNIQRLIDEGNTTFRGRGFGWTDYYRLDAIYEWLDSLAATYPQVNVVVGGQSYEGREIKGVKVSFKEGNPAVFIEGGIHAREWIAPATVTFILNEVLNSNDTRVRRIVEAFDWHVFPSVNPDGYEFSHTTERNWRKTRRPNEGSACVGTDANRNFPTRTWSENIADPCTDSHSGSSPFSEIETKTLAAYIQSVSSLTVYLSFHSYSQLLMYPRADTKHPVPNRDQLQAMADKAVAAIRRRYNTEYKAGSVRELIKYSSYGSSPDWVYEQLHVPVVFSCELRDEGDHGFLLPPEFIVPTGQETLDGVLSILADVRAAPGTYRRS